MTNRNLAGLLVIAFFSLSNGALCAAQTTFEQECAKLAAGSGNDSQRLRDLFKFEWAHRMNDSPEFATEVGYPGQNDRWTDQSLEAIERRKRELQAPIKVIQSIDRSKLNTADQLNYDLFKKDKEDAIEGTHFKDEYFPLTQLDGVHQDTAKTIDESPHATQKDYQNIVARLNALPALVDQTIALMSKGLEAGITPPRITLRDVPQQIKNQMVEDPDKNAFFKPFKDFPAEIPEQDRARLRAEAAKALQEKIIPAFAKLHEFISDKYIPGSREKIAMTDLPNGKAWYAFRARTSTTTSMTPQQIHDLGLSEVKRIRSEMDKVIEQTGFKGRPRS